MVLNSIMGAIRHQQVQVADIEGEGSTERQNTATSDELGLGELGSTAPDMAGRNVITAGSSIFPAGISTQGPRAHTSGQSSRFGTSAITPRAHVSTNTAGVSG